MNTLFYRSSDLQSMPYFLLGLMVLIIWSTVWKGIALWKAARLSQKNWFIALLVINTAGILEIIYIYFIAKKKEQTPQVIP